MDNINSNWIIKCIIYHKCNCIFYFHMLYRKKWKNMALVNILKFKSIYANCHGIYMRVHVCMGVRVRAYMYGCRCACVYGCTCGCLRRYWMLITGVLYLVRAEDHMTNLSRPRDPINMNWRKLYMKYTGQLPVELTSDLWPRGGRAIYLRDKG